MARKKNKNKGTFVHKKLPADLLLPIDAKSDDIVDIFQYLASKDLTFIPLERLELWLDKAEIYLCELGYKIYYQSNMEDDEGYNSKCTAYSELKKEIIIRTKKQPVKNIVKENAELPSTKSLTEDKEVYITSKQQLLAFSIRELGDKEMSVITDIIYKYIDKINSLKDDIREKCEQRKIKPNDEVLKYNINKSIAYLQKINKQKIYEVIKLSHLNYIKLEERIKILLSFVKKNIRISIYFDKTTLPYIKFANADDDSKAIISFLTLLGYQKNEMPINTKNIEIDMFFISKIHYVYDYLHKGISSYLYKYNYEELFVSLFETHKEKRDFYNGVFLSLSVIMEKIFSAKEDCFQVFYFYDIGYSVYYIDSAKLFDIYIANENVDDIKREEIYQTFDRDQQLLFQFLYDVLDIEFSINPYFEYYKIPKNNSSDNYLRLQFMETTFIGFRLNDDALEKIFYLSTILEPGEFFSHDNAAKVNIPDFNNMFDEEKFAWLKLFFSSELDFFKIFSNSSSKLVLDKAKAKIPKQLNTNVAHSAKAGLLFFHQPVLANIEKKIASEVQYIKHISFV